MFHSDDMPRDHRAFLWRFVGRLMIGIGMLLQESTAQRFQPFNQPFQTSNRTAAIPDGFTMSLPCFSNQFRGNQDLTCMVGVYSAVYQQLCDRRFQHCRDFCRETADRTQDLRAYCSQQPNNECMVEVNSAVYPRICPGRLKHLLITYACACVPASAVPPAPVPPPGQFAVASFASGIGGGLSICQFPAFKNFVGCNS